MCNVNLSRRKKGKFRVSMCKGTPKEPYITANTSTAADSELSDPSFKDCSKQELSSKESPLNTASILSIATI